jgi:outer membrane receptor protein involved in Fe transport
MGFKSRYLVAALMMGCGVSCAWAAPSNTDAPADGDESSAKAPIVVFGRAESKIGTANAASEGTIAGADMLVRPLLRTAELLEAVPGMIAAQHSGSGKANQYFLRGFNLDHGSDFATYVDGVPMNLRTHGHGQGYLDLNGLLPEAIDREDFRKGPYRADGGDFSLAGAAYMQTLARFDAPWASAEAGSFGSRKLAFGGSVQNVSTGELTFIGQLKRYDGPWEEAEKLRHISGFAKYQLPLGSNNLALSLHGYHAKWRPTEQIPERIIGSALCSDAFCSPDPTARGKTDRLIANVQFSGGALQANAYVQSYKWHMSSNPTYANADGSSAQINQFDSRITFGLKADWKGTLGPDVELALGTEIRHDDIGNVGVETTGGGSNPTSLGAYRVNESSFAGYGHAQWTPVDPLRLVLGLRADHYTANVRAKDLQAQALGEGRIQHTLVSPKATIAYEVAPWLEVYANWGRGFHSNDPRGAVAATPVPLLVRGTGKELGTRFDFGQFNFTATYWWLDVGSELRFVGDSNSVEPTGASKRHGVELVGFWRPMPWLAIDGNYTVSHSRYVNGDYVPNAFENAGQIGATILLPQWDLAIRWRHLGPYPLIEDNSVRDKGSDVVNFRGAYKAGKIELYGEVLNILNSRDKDIAYYYESFIPGFDAVPVEDRLSRVVEPRTFRLGMKVRF